MTNCGTKIPSVAEFIARQAEDSIGPSTVRNQGAAEVVKSARLALRKIDLRALSDGNAITFPEELDRATELVNARLPSNAKSWGIARKCVNIFLRNCLYNAYLRCEFDLPRIACRLEVPLDKVVVSELKRYFPSRSLPRWRGVKYLTREESEAFQLAASLLGDYWSIARVHLDTILWVEGRGTSPLGI